MEPLPDSNELLYRTHALTPVFSVSEKLGDASCMLPIYTNHFNLGFNKGTVLVDPHGLLTGTGNLIRHVDINVPKDYRNPKVKALILEAAAFAAEDMAKPSKIKKPTDGSSRDRNWRVPLVLPIRAQDRISHFRCKVCQTNWRTAGLRQGASAPE